LEGALMSAGYKTRDWGAEAHPDQVANFIRRMGLEPSVEAWAASTMTDPLPPAAQAWLDDLIQDDFVVGYELPVFLIRFLCSRNIPFLDISMDRVRFARDLFFAARTNAPLLESRLAQSEVGDDVIWADAGLLRAFLARRRSPEGGEGRVAVFFGQTNQDRCLVRNGRLVQPAAFAKTIVEITKDCDTILVRRHPHEETPHQISALHDILPNAKFTVENSYSLLCRGDVKRVISLSSGLMAEAKYFHKPSVALIEPDVNNAALLPVSCSRWYRLSPSLLMPGFWSGQLPAVTLEPDRIRNSLGERWGLTLYDAAPDAPDANAAEIERLRAALRAADENVAEMERLRAALRAAEENVAEMERLRAELQVAGENAAEVGRLRAALRAADENVAEMERLRAELRAADVKATQVERLRAELQAVHASTSWRLTAPLRALKGLLRR